MDNQEKIQKLTDVVETGVQVLKEATKAGVNYPAGVFLFKKDKPCISVNTTLTPTNQRACITSIGELCADKQCTEVIVSFDMYFIQAQTKDEIKEALGASSLSVLPKERRDEFLYTQYVNFRDIRKSVYSKWIYETKGPYISFIEEEFKSGVLSPSILRDLVLGFSTAYVENKVFKSKARPCTSDLIKAHRSFRRYYLKGFEEVISAAIPNIPNDPGLPQ